MWFKIQQRTRGDKSTEIRIEWKKQKEMLEKNGEVVRQVWTSSWKNHCAGRLAVESEMQTGERKQYRQSVPHMSPNTRREEIDQASEEMAEITLTKKNWWHAHNRGRTGVPRMHRG